MSSSRLDAKGFLASLFDFGFTSFVTLRFLKVIYMIVVGLIGLLAVIAFIGGLASGSTSGVLFGLIVVPLLALLYLIMARIYMEIIALFFRIGENTTIMAHALGGGGGSGGGTPAGPFGHGPNPPGPPSYGFGPGSAPTQSYGYDPGPPPAAPPPANPPYPNPTG